MLTVAVLALVAATVLIGCPEDSLAPPVVQDVPEVAPETGPELPRLTIDCAECHDYAALEAPAEGASAPARQWLAANGVGLIRRAPAIPTPTVGLKSPWPKRGHHAPTDLITCAGCHPVRDDGVGHTVRTYPYPSAVFSAATGCAPVCHAWLKQNAVVEGYRGMDDARPTYQGSLRPQELLTGVTTAHTLLWQKGARPDPEDTRITSFNPGCGGCHNIAAEAHGTITTCLDCHRFGGPDAPRHQLHVALIADHAATLDADATSAGISFCAYCHVEDAAQPESRSRSACYGCHLSGHQPLNAAGKAHFWPTPD